MTTMALTQQQDDSSPSPRFAAGEPATTVRHLAHDVQNWLTALQVYCDLLRTSGVVDDQGQPWIDELSSAVERGHALVDSLLDFAQSAALSRPLAPQGVAALPTLDLGAAIERRLPLLRQMAGNKIQVEIKTVPHAGATALREPEFERILLNLARNAMEAMPGGGKLRIVLEYGHASSGRCLLLRVSDTGRGIAAELLPHIFSSGVSTKLATSDGPRSRGFGLAIVRELTLDAGGSVRVRSRLGHGSSFTVELPLLEESLAESPLAKPRRAASHPRTRQLAVVSEMPKSNTDRPAHRNNCDANRKGTRVPC